MDLFFRVSFGCVWGLLILVWAAGWGSSKTTARRPAQRQGFIFFLPMVIGIALLQLHVLPQGWLKQVFWPNSRVPESVGLVITVLGVAFAIWARKTLGRNWSSMPEVKDNHQLVVQGPYKIVRHPIYSGLLLAFAGSVLALHRVAGVYLLVMCLASYWLKVRLEERLMIETFPDAYPEYKRRVKALIPGIL